MNALQRIAIDINSLFDVFVIGAPPGIGLDSAVAINSANYNIFP
jgi:MinD-like ATPase involved in chromosome partitioning or flagellar assembly